MPQSYLSIAPTEIWYHCWSFSDRKSIIQLSLTCKTFRAIAAAQLFESLNCLLPPPKGRRLSSVQRLEHFENLAQSPHRLLVKLCTLDLEFTHDHRRGGRRVSMAGGEELETLAVKLLGVMSFFPALTSLTLRGGRIPGGVLDALVALTHLHLHDSTLATSVRPIARLQSFAMLHCTVCDEEKDPAVRSRLRLQHPRWRPEPPLEECADAIPIVELQTLQSLTVAGRQSLQCLLASIRASDTARPCRFATLKMNIWGMPIEELRDFFSHCDSIEKLSVQYHEPVQRKRPGQITFPSRMSRRPVLPSLDAFFPALTHLECPTALVRIFAGGHTLDRLIVTEGWYLDETDELVDMLASVSTASLRSLALPFTSDTPMASALLLGIAASFSGLRELSLTLAVEQYWTETRSDCTDKDGEEVLLSTLHQFLDALFGGALTLPPLITTLVLTDPLPNAFIGMEPAPLAVITALVAKAGGLDLTMVVFRDYEEGRDAVVCRRLPVRGWVVEDFTHNRKFLY